MAVKSADLRIVLRQRLDEGIYFSDREAVAAGDEIFPYTRAHLALALDLRDRRALSAAGSYGGIGAGYTYVEIIGVEDISSVGDIDAEYYEDAVIDDLGDPLATPMPSGSLSASDIENHPFYDSIWDGSNWIDTWLDRSSYLLPSDHRIVETNGAIFYWHKDVEDGPDDVVIKEGWHEVDEDEPGAEPQTPAGWETWTIFAIEER